MKIRNLDNQSVRKKRRINYVVRWYHCKSKNYIKKVLENTVEKKNKDMRTKRRIMNQKKRLNKRRCIGN